MFHFKQFSINDDACGMKVGIDGVLLGAFVDKTFSPNKILDIGTGSGLLALMLAQKFPNSIIDAVELDALAANQAKSNFDAAQFSTAFNIFQQDFIEFESILTYDIIVSNPPFFSETVSSRNSQRDKARQSIFLPLDLLIRKVKTLLSNNGFFYLIYPTEQLDNLTNELKNNNLRMLHKLLIKGNVNTTAKRVLLKIDHISNDNHPLISEELIIEKARGEYTESYKNFTKDYYLKF